MDSLLW